MPKSHTINNKEKRGKKGQVNMCVCDHYAPNVKKDHPQLTIKRAIRPIIGNSANSVFVMVVPVGINPNGMWLVIE